MKKIYLLTLTALIISLSLEYSNSINYYGYSNDYMQYGAGGKALAMGGAFVAVGDDATAAYWNPACLERIDEHQLYTMYAPFFFDSSYSFASYVHPLGPAGTLSISDTLLYSGNFVKRSVHNVIESDNESILHHTLLLSYGRKLRDIRLPFKKYINMGVGLNLKMVQEKDIGYSGTGFGADLGVLFYPFDFLSWGIVLSNAVAPKVTLKEEADLYQPNLKTGFAFKSISNRLTVSTDINNLQTGQKSFSAGVELIPAKNISLRAGYNYLQDVTFGIGLEFAKRFPFSFDYAYSNSNMGILNRVSVSFKWANIYTAALKPAAQKGNTFVLQGLLNEVELKTETPSFSVKKWRLDIIDGKGNTVKYFEGDTKPPQKILWDLLDESGRPMQRGVYNYSFRLKYENDKTWEDKGSINLEFPDLNRDSNESVNIEIRNYNPLTLPSPSRGEETRGQKYEKN